MQERVFVSSFNHRSMALFKRLCPEVECGLLYSAPMVRTVAYAARAGADAMHPRFDILKRSPALVEKLHAAGVKVNAWTVDEPADVRAMLALGVDCIISDWPDRLVSEARGRI